MYFFFALIAFQVSLKFLAFCSCSLAWLPITMLRPRLTYSVCCCTATCRYNLDRCHFHGTVTHLVVSFQKQAVGKWLHTHTYAHTQWYFSVCLRGRWMDTVKKTEVKWHCSPAAGPSLHYWMLWGDTASENPSATIRQKSLSSKQ